MSDGEGGGLTRWFVLAMGIGFLVFSVWIYRYLAGLEAAGGSIRIHWLFAFIYKAFGKLGVSIGIALFSVLCIWLFFKPDFLDREE
jgi:hypothetical protein